MSFNTDFKFNSDKDLYANLSDLVSWTGSAVKRVQWSNEKIRDDFARRSTKKILEDGDSCFLNPCLDLSLVGYHALKDNGYSPDLLVEELYYHKYSSYSLHFAVNFDHNDEQYFLDFKELNRVIINKGEYKNINPLVESIQIFPFDKDIPFDIGFVDLAKDFFPRMNHFSLNNLIERLVSYNKPSVHTDYLSQVGDAKNLYLEHLG